MITVESVQKKEQEKGKTINAVNEEQLQTGQVRVLKQSIVPWIIGLLALGGLGYWLWKRGKQNNGEVSG
jgi:hypothetical protein